MGAPGTGYRRNGEAERCQKSRQTLKGGMVALAHPLLAVSSAELPESTKEAAQLH